MGTRSKNPWNISQGTINSQVMKCKLSNPLYEDDRLVFIYNVSAHNLQKVQIEVQITIVLLVNNRKYNEFTNNRLYLHLEDLAISVYKYQNICQKLRNMLYLQAMLKVFDLLQSACYRFSIIVNQQSWLEGITLDTFIFLIEPFRYHYPNIALQKFSNH